MNPIRELISDLEIERKELEDKIISVINQIEDVRKNCPHRDDSGNSTFKFSIYDGIKDVYECSICGKRTIKRGI